MSKTSKAYQIGFYLGYIGKTAEARAIGYRMGYAEASKSTGKVTDLKKRAFDMKNIDWKSTGIGAGLGGLAGAGAGYLVNGGKGAAIGGALGAGLGGAGGALYGDHVRKQEGLGVADAANEEILSGVNPDEAAALAEINKPKMQQMFEKAWNAPGKFIKEVHQADAANKAFDELQGNEALARMKRLKDVMSKEPPKEGIVSAVAQLPGEVDRRVESFAQKNADAAFMNGLNDIDKAYFNQLKDNLSRPNLSPAAKKQFQGMMEEFFKQKDPGGWARLMQMFQ